MATYREGKIQILSLMMKNLKLKGLIHGRGFSAKREKDLE
jgi:hypothetical protein